MSDLIVPNEISGGAVYGIPQYDYTVINDDPDRAAEELRAILES